MRRVALKVVFQRAAKILQPKSMCHTNDLTIAVTHFEVATSSFCISMAAKMALIFQPTRMSDHAAANFSNCEELQAESVDKMFQPSSILYSLTLLTSEQSWIWIH